MQLARRRRPQRPARPNAKREEASASAMRTCESGCRGGDRDAQRASRGAAARCDAPAAAGWRAARAQRRRQGATTATPRQRQPGARRARRQRAPCRRKGWGGARKTREVGPPARKVPTASRAALQARARCVKGHAGARMRSALRAALRAADLLAAMPPVHAAAAPPVSRVPTAVALAAARALSGAAAGGSGSGSGGGVASPPAEPLVNVPSEPLAGGGAKRKELYMVFTCGRCETRAVKGFSRQAYEHGTRPAVVACTVPRSKHARSRRTRASPQGWCWWTAPAARRGTSSPTARAGSATKAALKTFWCVPSLCK